MVYYNGLWKQQYPEGSKGHGGRWPHEKVWQPGIRRRLLGWQNSKTLPRFLLSEKRFPFAFHIVWGHEADWRGPSSGTTGQIYIDLLGAASGESERRKKKGERELCASRRRRVGEIYTRTSSAASSSQREATWSFVREERMILRQGPVGVYFHSTPSGRVNKRTLYNKMVVWGSITKTKWKWIKSLYPQYSSPNGHFSSFSIKSIYKSFNGKRKKNRWKRYSDSGGRMYPEHS